VADDAVVPMMFRESGMEERASAEFKCLKNGRSVYYPMRVIKHAFLQDVWRVLSHPCDGIKIQESRIPPSGTYGLTRGKGETDCLLRSFSYSTILPVFGGAVALEVLSHCRYSQLLAHRVNCAMGFLFVRPAGRNHLRVEVPYEPL